MNATDDAGKTDDSGIVDKSTQLGRVTQRAMGMSDAVWQRHVNPWSYWTRVPVLPLIGLAIWSRVWIGWWCLIPISILAVWVWLNPRVFPPPKTVDNWMSQGVLGERIWLAGEAGSIASHHRRVIQALVAVSGSGAMVMIAGLAILQPTLAVAGCSISVLGKLWFIDRMVWLYRDQESTQAE